MFKTLKILFVRVVNLTILTLWSTKILRALTYVEGKTIAAILTWRITRGLTIRYNCPAGFSRCPVTVFALHCGHASAVRELMTIHTNNCTDPLKINNICLFMNNNNHT